MLVGVIPTGKMELRALGLALQQIFPGHEFETIAKNSLERIPFPGFTSNQTLALFGGPLRELVGAMVAAAMNRPKYGKPPDLVVIVEDAELFHSGNPEEIVSTFRSATQSYLQEIYGAAARVHQVLRTKVSFHIAMPMIESWLFADPEGPRNAGASFPANWRRDLDPERFLTEDSLYLTDDGSSCEAFRSKSKQQPAWLPTPTSPLLGRSSEHPKWYLSWLCRNPESKNCSNYRETKEGAQCARQDQLEERVGPSRALYLPQIPDRRPARRSRNRTELRITAWSRSGMHLAGSCPCRSGASKHLAQFPQFEAQNGGRISLSSSSSSGGGGSSSGRGSSGRW